jgi:hypothetical protein
LTCLARSISASKKRAKSITHSPKGDDLQLGAGDPEIVFPVFDGTTDSIEPNLLKSDRSEHLTESTPGEWPSIWKFLHLPIVVRKYAKALDRSVKMEA